MVEFMLELVMFVGSLISWIGGITIVSMAVGFVLMLVTNKHDNLLHDTYIAMYDSFKDELGSDVKALLITLWTATYLTILCFVLYPFISIYLTVEEKIKH